MGKRNVPKNTVQPPVPLDQLTREYPSEDCLPRAGPRMRDFESFSKKYRKFLEHSRTPDEVIHNVVNLLSKNNFQRRDILKTSGRRSKDEKYFFVDPWNKSSMVAVIEGKKPINNGFHLIVAHGDSPALVLKSRPIRREWDPDLIENRPGVRLSCIAYGGIQPHQWVGTKVKVIGFSERYRKKIEFDGFVLDHSAHIDNRGDEELDDAFPHENTLEIITGHKSPKEFLKYLGFKDEDDFSSSRFFAVPKENQTMGIPTEISPRLLIGYGHDDRASVYAAQDALLKTANPEYTSILWITGNEEIGDNPPSGAKSILAKLAIEQIIQNQKLNLSSLERALIIPKSSVLIADVVISPFNEEYNNADHFSSSKIGRGVAIISAHGQESLENFPRFIEQIRGLTDLKNGICRQMCGNTENQEEIGGYESSWAGGYLMAEGAQWVYAGTPCANLHGQNEIISPADHWWAKRLYQEFYKSKIVNTGK